jgi:5'-3' exonuclease
MGVPAFFRWLVQKYPNVLENIGGPGDSNPQQDLCIDNLYLDMNGIIHPCCHPEHGIQPKDETEMLENVGRMLDRLITTVRPKKLVYMAIDGVAPRAKMNQQRARRFCSAREAEEHEEVR